MPGIFSPEEKHAWSRELNPHRGSPLRGNPQLIAADPFGMVCHVLNFETRREMSSPAVAVVRAAWRSPVT
jgi:hypothetical protein